MPLTPTYALPVSECPALLTPASILDPTAAYPASPLAFEAFAQGQTTGVSQALNRNSRRAENLARYGGAGGGYAVAAGLELSDSGTALTVAVSAGVSIVDAPQVKASAGSVVCTNNAYNWIWHTNANALTPVARVAPTPVPAAASAACAFLGRVFWSGGALVEIDYSGRLWNRGGLLYRRTADAGMPDDSPPAALAFAHRTEGGLWYWDGSEYTLLSGELETVIASVVEVEDDLLDLQRSYRALLRHLFQTIGLPFSAEPTLLNDTLRAVEEGPEG